MAVLVTGGAGYIGSHMVLALLDAGERVVVVDDLSTGFRSAVPAGVALVEGDFGDQALVERAIAEHGVDAIAHFAARIVVPDSVADPLGYYLNNTAKARNLIESAVRSGVTRFIFSSTAAVYGETDAGLVTEDRPLKPRVALRPLEADGGMDAGGCRPRPRPPRRGAALLQRGGRRPARPRRPVDAGRHPPHQGRGADRAGPPSAHADLRRRLSHARRHLPARLHPGDGPRGRPTWTRCATCAAAARASPATSATPAAIR